MKKTNIFPRHPVADFLVFLFLVLITLAALRMFFSEVQKLQKDEEGEIIAQILDVHGLVMVRNRQTSHWHTLQENTRLEDGDLIKTDFNASLSFALKNHDHMITVHENSSLKAVVKNGRYFLEYIDGGITVNESSHIDDWYFLSGRKKISAGDFSKILISRENDFISKLVLTVERGNAGIQEISSDTPYEMPVFLLPPDILTEGNSLILEKSVLK